jgi:hypothetical protein
MQRFHFYTEIDLETGKPIVDLWNFYEGAIALADRSLANEAQQNEESANGVAGTAGANAASDRAMLIPTLRADMTGTNGLTATQKSQALVAANQGAGGAAGGLGEKASLTAGRTGNSGSLSGVLDAIARARTQAGSQANLNVENQSTKLAQQRQQQAMGQVQGLYGTDVSSQLKGMGLANEDENTELNANKQGWLQNTEGVISTLGGAATSASHAGGFS